MAIFILFFLKKFIVPMSNKLRRLSYRRPKSSYSLEKEQGQNGGHSKKYAAQCFRHQVSGRLTLSARNRKLIAHPKYEQNVSNKFANIN